MTWSAERLGEALGTLARHAGLNPRDNEPAGPRTGTEPRQLDAWIEAAATWLGLEAEPVSTLYPEVNQLIVRAGPALLRVGGEQPRFLTLVSGTRHRVTVLTPAGVSRTLPVASLRAALCAPVEAPVLAEVERLLTAAAVPPRRRPRAQQALLQQLLARTSVDGCWLLRPVEASGFLPQARQAGLGHLLASLVGASVCEYAVWLLSWWLLGWMALQGRLDFGWLLAWWLLLFALVPFRLWAASAGGLLAIRGGAALKRRLLVGALRLESDEVRHLGAGQLLGRVVESEVLETSLLQGGFLGVTAVLELMVVTFILVAGAGGLLHVGLLVGVLLVAVWLGLRYYRQRSRWTDARLALTNDLVERLVGHRTRLAQEPRATWNEGEDQALERYLELSQNLDRAALRLQVLVPRGWLLLGLLGLAPTFITGGASTTALAVALGGVVLAHRALRALGEGLERLAGAAVAWQRVQLFWQAAGRQEPVGAPRLVVEKPAAAATPCQTPPALLDVRGLNFRYPGRGSPVLSGVALRIHPGERLLLEGPSGQGKSTLAALLAGCRNPESGLLLLGGLDLETLGAASWRKRVVLAPQFHENHVLLGTFAFNLLLGCTWPPSDAALAEAEQVCRDLGLGPLLERMPGGLLQLVGETGWQLSHGEKSRLYLARALLQGGDLLLLDESFGALDPETLAKALTATLQRPVALLVIAHP